MKKKLLFINGHLDTGGVEKALLNILKHLNYEEYEVDLLLTEHLGDYIEQLPMQVNVILRSIEHTYGSFPNALLRSIGKFDWFSLRMRLIFLTMRLFGQNKISLAKKLMTDKKHYDCVIGFRPGFCTQLAAFCVNADQRITWWHHGEINVNRDSYEETARSCDAVAIVSESLLEVLARTFPSLKEKMTVIPNILDLEAISKMATSFDPYEGSSVFHIVSVGRLVPEKHFDNIIYAAKRLKEHKIDFRWHLLGSGILDVDLFKKAKQMNVSDCVIFEGNQVNPYPYIKHADLFVHPSYVESFGIVVTEALALGTPCVVTKSMGVMDFLVDGENAVLTEQNPEDLAEKVMLVLENSDLRRKLKENAQCPEQFFPEMVMQKIDALLEK